jgi:hypothetical protein
VVLAAYRGRPCPRVNRAPRRLSERIRNHDGGNMASKYGKKAGQKVKRAMHERKRGTLKSGRSGKKVKSRKQAIAIGLSEARKSGAKVPRKKKSASRKKKKSK